MTRRSGMTLVEVLVAIFIMGIGLVALLTLFPIGILRIAQAIRDDRCVSCVINAQAISQVNNLRNDIDVVSDANYQPYDPANPILDLFVNPYPRDAAGLPQLPDADPYGESYPVLADPIGFLGTGGVTSHWVAGAPGFLRRRPVEFARRGVANMPALQLNVQRNFTLWDDLNFDNGDPVAGASPGTPTILAATVPPTISRNPRFSWAYLFRRPQTQERSVVDCAVVVFENRPSGAEYLYAGAGSNPTYFDPVKNTITIDYTGNVPPPLRPGNWILDNTIYRTGPSPGAGLPPIYGSAHAYFYRIVNAEDLVVAGRQLARYEVQQPLRGFPPLIPPLPPPGFTTVNDPTDTSAAPAQVFQGTAIVMEGVAEVFEKGPIRLP